MRSVWLIYKFDIRSEFPTKAESQEKDNIFKLCVPPLRINLCARLRRVNLCVRNIFDPEKPVHPWRIPNLPFILLLFEIFYAFQILEMLILCPNNSIIIICCRYNYTIRHGNFFLLADSGGINCYL